MKTFIWSRFHNLILLNGHNKSDVEIIKPRNHAFGVDDVEVLIPADVQINTFSNDRQQYGTWPEKRV
jgi:hypothetical protein